MYFVCYLAGLRVRSGQYFSISLLQNRLPVSVLFILLFEDYSSIVLVSVLQLLLTCYRYLLYTDRIYCRMKFNLSLVIRLTSNLQQANHHVRWETKRAVQITSWQGQQLPVNFCGKNTNRWRWHRRRPAWSVHVEDEFNIWIQVQLIRKLDSMTMTTFRFLSSASPRTWLMTENPDETF